MKNACSWPWCLSSSQAIYLSILQLLWSFYTHTHTHTRTHTYTHTMSNFLYFFFHTGVPPQILQPELSWPDRAKFHDTLESLAKLFMQVGCFSPEGGPFLSEGDLWVVITFHFISDHPKLQPLERQLRHMVPAGLTSCQGTWEERDRVVFPHMGAWRVMVFVTGIAETGA